MSPAAEVIAANADSVYFLMFEGWENELRSNRWHFATRWARRLPVVLVQPVQQRPPRTLQSRPEPRIHGVRILDIQSSWSLERYFADATIQVGQVADDLRRHGFGRPLFWCYNPTLLAPYVSIPAVSRVFHATEDFPKIRSVPAILKETLEPAVRASDLTVAVSAGVASSLSATYPGIEPALITNGCDFREYDGAEADPELAQMRDGYERIAIYAGNVNDRIDFSLVAHAAATLPRTLFVFTGPVTRLTSDDAKRWQAFVMRPNVEYLGPVPPERLPALYAASDVGMIPYRQIRVLVESGFPLKALEMAATGLPVVATKMVALKGLARALVVADDSASFVEVLGTLDRSTASQSEIDELRNAARANDYDRKFDDLLDLLVDRLHAPEVAGGLHALMPGYATSAYLDHAIAFVRVGSRFSDLNAAGATHRERIAQRYIVFASRQPRLMKRLVPGSLRALLRALLIRGA